MSSGIMICSKCNREVHQDGPKDFNGDFMWLHCNDKTPRCHDGEPIYAQSKTEIAGKWCGKDDINDRQQRS